LHLPHQRPWAPWPESRQLCESQPFRLFCESQLPDSYQRKICESCGLPVEHPRSPHSKRHSLSQSENVFSPDQYGDPFLSYDLHQSPYRLSRHGCDHGCG